MYVITSIDHRTRLVVFTTINTLTHEGTVKSGQGTDIWYHYTTDNDGLGNFLKEQLFVHLDVKDPELYDNILNGDGWDAETEHMVKKELCATLQDDIDAIRNLYE